MFPFFLPFFLGGTSKLSDAEYQKMKKDEYRCEDEKEKIIKFLKKNKNKDVTAKDIAEATGVEQHRVMAITTMMQRHREVIKTSHTITNDDGSQTEVKYIKLI